MNRLVALLAGTLALMAVEVHGDIYRWDNGEVIPGTEGVVPGPGVDLDLFQLEYADLSGLDLTHATLSGTNLSFARISASDLSHADFSGARLAKTFFIDTTLDEADFAGAILNGTIFRRVTEHGFSRSQLESTASYLTRDLRFIQFQFNEMSGWSFREQDLWLADLQGSTFDGADFSGANLQSANLNAQIFNANFSGADLRGLPTFDGADSDTTNAILPDGKVAGLDLGTGERLTIHDDDGVPPNQPYFWLTERAPLPVTVHEHLTMADGGALRLVFDADDWDSIIRFDDGIPVQLGGALELDFEKGVHLASQVGRTYHVFDWANVAPTGQFQIVSEYQWDTSRLYSHGDVTLQAVPEPGTLSLAGLLVAGVLSTTWRRRIRD